MKLNFKGFFKAASLFPLALMLSGCISYALVSHTAKGSSGKYQSQSDTITGLSQAKDSNGTKGYVFVGESLDYLITDGADDIVKMLNDPALNRHNIQVANDARFVLNAGKRNLPAQYRFTTTGITKKKRHWQRIMVLPVVFNTVPGHWKT